MQTGSFLEHNISALAEKGLSVGNLSMITGISIDSILEVANAGEKEMITEEEFAFLNEVTTLLNYCFEVDPEERLVAISKTMFEGFQLSPSFLSHISNVEEESIRAYLEGKEMSCESRFKYSMSIMMLHFILKWPSQHRMAAQIERIHENMEKERSAN